MAKNLYFWLLHLIATHLMPNIVSDNRREFITGHSHHVPQITRQSLMERNLIWLVKKNVLIQKSQRNTKTHAHTLYNWRHLHTYTAKLNYKSFHLNWFVYSGWITSFYWTNRTTTTTSYFFLFLTPRRSSINCCAISHSKSTMSASLNLMALFDLSWMENENKIEATIGNLRRLLAATRKDKHQMSKHIMLGFVCVCVGTGVLSKAAILMCVTLIQFRCVRCIK